jgi:hypothetical protein
MAHAYEPVPHPNEPSEPVRARSMAAARPRAAGVAVRIGLTLIAAALLIIGAFTEVLDGILGRELPIRSLISTSALDDSATFLTSVGFAMIVVGLVAILGMAPRSGVLTSLAGTVAIVGVVLYLISQFRAADTLNAVDVGTWLWGIGGLCALIAGFFGTRPMVVREEVVQPTHSGPRGVAS